MVMWYKLGLTPGFTLSTPVSPHTNANIGANEGDLYKLGNLFRKCCEINEV